MGGFEDPRIEFATVVTSCARCGKRHVVQWRKFKQPCGEYTHWGWCEKTEDPILLKIENVAE